MGLCERHILELSFYYYFYHQFATTIKQNAFHKHLVGHYHIMNFKN